VNAHNLDDILTSEVHSNDAVHIKNCAKFKHPTLY